MLHGSAGRPGGRRRPGRPLARPGGGHAGPRSPATVGTIRIASTTASQERHPTAAVIVAPRAMAVPNEMAETKPTQRDRHLQLIAAHGRMGWQKASGYTKRARAEAAIARWKQVIGDGCARARTSVGDRGGGRHPCPPHDGAGTPELRPHRLIPDGGGVVTPTPLIHAPRLPAWHSAQERSGTCSGRLTSRFFAAAMVPYPRRSPHSFYISHRRSSHNHG